MYDHILVPTDGSDEVAGAVAEAIDLAAAVGGRVHALYVVDSRNYSTLTDSKWLTLEEALREEGEAAVGTVEARAAEADVPVTTAVERGIPHERIIEYATANEIDLVVMGTHGRTGLDRVLLGSVTEKVVRQSPVPVLVIRVGEPAEA
jgi:nucleotide-binding universal stress UspA family protein